MKQKILYILGACLLFSCHSNRIHSEKTTEDRTSKPKEEQSKSKCSFVFGPEAAINCAGEASEIIGFTGEWPEGENSTTFFKKAEGNFNLRSIDFCRVKVDSLTESIVKIPNLESLHLNHGSITKVPDYIGQLKNLVSLSFGSSKTECGGNKISYISPKIGNCISLEYLGLAFSVIEDLPEELHNCVNLKTIDLGQNNTIDLAKLAELRKRFPKIQILSHLE